MSTAQHIAERYVAVWNETDADQRAAMLREDWADNARYVDPIASVTGLADIGTLIANVQQRFPGYRFVLASQPNGYDNHVRFSWTLGPAAATPPIEGSDVVVTDGGASRR